MQPLTTSIYTFAKLRDAGFLYVDKTAFIHELVARPGQYFLARPRRFGKSLLISTLKAIFQGRRELFAGLHIAGTDYDWKVHPVVHLNLGSCAADTPEMLEESLRYAIDANARMSEIELPDVNAQTRFQELIERLYARSGPVVVLVDEYDKPLLGHLGEETALPVQKMLKGFYSVIKTTESCQRFALLTGVSKFSKVSIFSDLNNLTDLTMNRQAATLLGYTQAELETNFYEHIDLLATELGKDHAGALAELRAWYNGYRFEENSETVYNPVSVMKALQELKLKNYWFETGTPSFLINLLRRQPIDLNDLNLPETAFSAYEADRLAALPLLFQTGYLTIKSAERAGEINSYRLGFPNREIENSFSYWLARDFAEIGDVEAGGAALRLKKALDAGDVDLMLETMKIFFAQIPHNISIRQEKYYQTIFFAVFKILGAMIEAEVSTNIGRIDAVAKTGDAIYVFEFKLDGTAAAALAQIKAKGYAEPYRADPRRTVLVGVGFTAAERNISEWLIEECG